MEPKKGGEEKNEKKRTEAKKGGEATEKKRKVRDGEKGEVAVPKKVKQAGTEATPEQVDWAQRGNDGLPTSARPPASAVEMQLVATPQGRVGEGDKNGSNKKELDSTKKPGLLKGTSEATSYDFWAPILLTGLVAGAQQYIAESRLAARITLRSIPT